MIFMDVPIDPPDPEGRSMGRSAQDDLRRDDAVVNRSHPRNNKESRRRKRLWKKVARRRERHDKHA
jgi:hypothetical protein